MAIQFIYGSKTLANQCFNVEDEMSLQNTSEIAPLVSVIIPCYNREAYVADAINSLLRQTYPRIEIVAVDDGSTDRTVEVIQSFGDKVSLVRQKNLGVSAARNTGIHNSTGEYIVFLDSDDWLSDDAIEVHMLAAKQWPEADVYGLDTAQPKADNKIVVTGADWPSTPDQPLGLLLLQPPLYFPSQMYRRRALKRVGYLDESFRSHEDSDCLIRVVLTGGAIVRSGGGYAVYRPTPNSLTKNALRGHKYGVLFIRKLKKQFANHIAVTSGLVDERLLRIRLRYWNSFFSFHYSLQKLEPIKFLYHFFRVSLVDPGYIIFILRDRPWSLPLEREF